MLKLLKASALMSVLGFCGLSVSWAGAAEWHANGPLTKFSTDAGATRWVIHPHTASQGSTAIECTLSVMHATLQRATSTEFPWTYAATVTPLFTNCSAAGVPSFQVICAPAAFRASAYQGGATFATAGGGITTGVVTHIDCRVSIGPVNCVTITGSVPAHYTNAGSAGGAITGNGRLTLTATGQALTADEIIRCAPIPSGTVTWGSPGATATAINDLTYTFDGPNAPYFYRTP